MLIEPIEIPKTRRRIYFDKIESKKSLSQQKEKD